MSIYDNGFDSWLRKGNSLTEPINLEKDTTVPLVSVSNSQNNPINSGVASETILSGELGSLLGHGKKTFSDSQAGILMGLDRDNIYKWIIGTPTNGADWAVTTANTFTIHGNLVAGTIAIGTSPDWFKVDASGNTWWGAVAFADAPASITPAGVAKFESGTIAGWTLSATALSTGAYDTLNTMYFGTSGLSLSNTFKVSSAGVIDATSGTIGGCVLGETSIGSTSFVSGPLGSGWNISNSGTAEFQNITVRGIIRTSVFEKDTISAVNGIVLVSSADVLASDMTALDVSTVIITGETTFSANEVIRLKDGSDDEWMLITNAGSAPTYTVTRDLASNYTADNNPVWKKGTAVVSMGVGTGTKTGFVLLDSSSANSPYIDIYGRNSNTYSDYTLHGRFGWLKGIIDADVGLSSTDVWGLYTDNAYIKGVIVADTGYIGGTSGWTIGSGIITGTGVTLSNTGNAYIAFGDTPPTAEDSGTGVFIDKTGVAVVDSDVQKVRVGDLNGFLDYSSSLFGIAAGEETKYFKYDPTNGLRIRGNFQRNDFRWFTLFEGIDGYSSVLNGGTITTGGVGLFINSIDTSLEYIEMYKDVTQSFNTFSWDKSWKLRFSYELTHTDWQYVWITIGGGTTGTTTNTDRHFGIYIYGGNVRGSVGNGTSQSTLQLDTVDTNPHSVEISYTPGSGAEFIYDGVSIGTISTNLPSGTSGANRIYDVIVDPIDDASRGLYLYMWDVWMSE